MVRGQVPTATAVWTTLVPLTHVGGGEQDARLVLGSAGGLPKPWKEVTYGLRPGNATVFDGRLIHRGGGRAPGEGPLCAGHA